MTFAGAAPIVGTLLLALSTTPPPPAQEKVSPIHQAIQELRDADAAKRRSAAERLLKAGAEAYGPLEEALEAAKAAPDETFRKAAEEVLAEIAAKLQPTIHKLVAQLGHDRYEVRENAGAELEKIGKPALEALQKAAKSEDPEVRFRAAALVKSIKRGPWRAIMFDFCRGEGYDTESIQEIAGDLAERFFPDSRFFMARTRQDDNHYRVTKHGRQGGVAHIPLSTGGDVTSMIGEARPVIRNERDAGDFLWFCVCIRYGFEELQRPQMKLDKIDDRSWGMRAKTRYFTLFLDGNARLIRIQMD